MIQLSGMKMEIQDFSNDITLNLTKLLKSIDNIFDPVSSQFAQIENKMKDNFEKTNDESILNIKDSKYSEFKEDITKLQVKVANLDESVTK